MSRLLAAMLAISVCVVAGPARAHHSMSAYEFLATTIEGTVQEFKYINPHAILILKTTGPSGTTVWHLEGDPPATLARAGFNRNTFRPGDRVKLQIQKLKDGKPGGFWNIRMIILHNGREFEGHQCMLSPDGCEGPQ